MSFVVPRYSNAFDEYVHNRYEVNEILHTAPPDGEQLTSPRRRELANALHRGSVMLLSGHLERYVESLVVEAIDAINSAAPPVNQIPEPLRMIQAEQALFDAWGSSQRDRKKTMQIIKKSVSEFPWIWSDKDPCGNLKAEFLIGENRFSNPTPYKINEVFDYFGIGKVVSKAVDLYQSPDKGLIEIKVSELIQKRNEIAHTATASSLTRQDVIDYLIHSRKLVRAIDIVVGRQIQTITGAWPWK